MLIREDRGSESPATEENTRIGIGVSSYRSGRQNRRKYKIGDRNPLPQNVRQNIRQEKKENVRSGIGIRIKESRNQRYECHLDIPRV